MSKLGIDISDFQTVDSFHSVATSGIGFVVCKATQGTRNVQDTFANYRARIEATEGLTFGAYHFMDWEADPVAQAQHFLSVYAPASGDLPPMLDLEAFTVGADRATEMIAAFLGVVDPHLNGKRMLLYTDWDAINSQAFATDSFAGHPLWLAVYGNSYSVPRTWAAPTIWQYGDTGRVPGIEGDVDQDKTIGDDFESLLLRLQ